MRIRVGLLVALTLVAVVAGAGTAVGLTLPTAPYAEPADCYACHTAGGSAADAPVSFDVATVDRNACKTCHAGIPLPVAVISDGDHFHGTAWTCTGRDGCHNWPYYQEPTFAVPAGEVVQPLVVTTYGRFTAVSSLTAPSTTMHGAHAGTSWVATEFSYDSRCTSCHTEVSCGSCHTTTVAHGAHGGYTCTSSECHGNVDAGVSVPTCASCHPNAADETHGASHVAADGSAEGIACSECHALDMVDEHARPTSSTTLAACTACHPDPAADAMPWNGSCVTAGCHTVASSAPMHAGASVAHQVDTANGLCLDCHAGTELGSIHADAVATDGATSCLVCHTGAAGEPATSDCTVCHFTFSEHYSSTAHTSSTLVGCGGEGCHTTPDLLAVHTQRNSGFGCGGCHDSVNADVQNAIATGLTGCTDCHGGISALTGHRDAHWATPPLANDDGTPNYSYYTGSAGSAPTRDCAGCHTSNLVDEHLGLYLGGWVTFPRYDSTGAAFTCGTCHDQPANSTVQDAILAGRSACESCHPVHGPIAVLHESAFVDDPAIACADCHDADLSAEHAGVKSSAGLSGCDVCHALYEGDFGATVQSAISVTNDKRCTACHSTYHDNVAPHEATTAASLACAECHGAVTGAVLDVNSVHPSCNTCHNAASGRIDWSNATFECSSCHVTAGSDYHAGMSTSHTYAAMPTSCTSGSTCHQANTLPEEHERFISRYGYTSTCSLCHKNVDPARIPAGATASCSSCHTVHGDIAVVHTATSSSACVACHETADVRALHGSSVDASCAVCHEAPAGRIDWSTATVECTSCHGALSPADPNHYPLAAHAATTEAGCVQCHSADLKTEHFKPTVSPAVTCVSCHEGRVDAFTAPWDKTCTACHPTKHANQAVAHKSSNTSCTGTGCHVVTDVSVLHGTNCAACHGAGITPSTDCAKCHTGANPHHATITLNMSTSSQWESVCGSCHGRVHNRGSCLNCHSRDMHGESHHIERNANCAICHKVAAADAGDNCLGCHTNLGSSSDGSWGGGSWGGGSWDGGSGGTTTSGAVSGTITNSATGAAISGATVSVAGKTATSGYSGTYSISDVSAGTYTMTVTASGYQAWSGSVTVSSGSTLTKNVALSATAPTATNLARAGTATASSTSSYYYAASKAIDGDTSTYWRSSSAGTQWLRIDLGSAKTISKVVVSWLDTRYARAYRVETSNDGTTWATQYSTTSGASGTQTITFAPVNARYVRVYCTTANDYDYRISELQVWGY